MYICKGTFLAVHRDGDIHNIFNYSERDFEVKKDTFWSICKFSGHRNEVVLWRPKNDLVRQCDVIFLNYLEFQIHFDYFYLSANELKENDKNRKLILDLRINSTYDYHRTLLYYQKEEAEILIKTYISSMSSENYLNDNYKSFLEKESRNLIGRDIALSINKKLVHGDLITEDFLASDVLKGQVGSYVEVFESIDVRVFDDIDTELMDFAEIVVKDVFKGELAEILQSDC